MAYIKVIEREEATGDLTGIYRDLEGDPQGYRYE
jgi:hypothetical protein